jgi:Zn-dependent peptidase ImmA (M78 family)
VSARPTELIEVAQHLAQSPTQQVLRRRLLDCADAWSPQLLGAGPRLSAFGRLGITVRTRELGGLSGACRLHGGDPEVLVATGEHVRRQRFTAAHEVAHLLMANVDRARIGLEDAAHERLCDAFAQRLLIPADDLRQQAAGWAGDPRGLLRLADRYGVGIAAILRATCGVQAERQRLLIAAEVRGHPQRPDKIALRAHLARSGHLFVPAHVRLSTLGLGGVEAWMRDRADGQAWGIAPRASFRLWRQAGPARSGSAEGPVGWQALALGRGRVLVALSTQRLSEAWSSARAGGRPVEATA